VFIAHWIDRNAKTIGTFQRGLVPIAAMLAGVLALLMLEKDVGTSIVMVGIVLSAYWAGGGRFRHVVLLIAVLGLGLIAVTLFEQYRFARLVSFRDPFSIRLAPAFNRPRRCMGLVRAASSGSA